VGFDSSRPHTYPIVGRFFRSDATSSRLIDDFYSRRDELRRKKGSGKATGEEEAKLKDANQVAVELSDLRKQAESVRKNDSLSNKQKYDELEEIAKFMQNNARQFLNSK
jgi:ribosomal protein L19E